MTASRQQLHYRRNFGASRRRRRCFSTVPAEIVA